MNIHQSINNENNPTRALSDIKSVTVHHTGTNADSMNYLNRTDYISAHYLIKKNGEIWQLMENNRVAYHAGVSEWHSLQTKGNSLNWCTVGIEVESDGYDFNDNQKNSAKELILFLMDLYNIPSDLVLRHKDISPDRKWDIGESFYAPLKSWGEYQLTLKAMTPQEVKLTELNIAVCGNSYDNGNEKQKVLAKKHAGELRDLLSNN